MKNKRHNYEQLDMYNRSLAIAVEVMEFIDTVRPCRIAEQISASYVSVPSNIAESSERGSDKNSEEF
jgi:four helix bundle protein